ncbi:MAG: glycosyltransferase family 1 protein [Henriciella sp.]|uniref:glycosyltransferase family 4 protein n=1 Tax=Henriciella sp. TaxID=1968823 RepID=UPI003C74B570
MKRICFNGKFLSAKPTGVHRVSEELIRGIDTLLGQYPELQSATKWEILCPKDADRQLPLDHIETRTVGRTTWQVWEQFELPFFARGALLVSLCNLAPLSHRHAITMIHDAQTFITPESYSLPFRKWYQFALPTIGRRNRRVLTVSDYSRQQLAKYGVAPTDKISVIHNGVDHAKNTGEDVSILERFALKPNQFAVGLANTQAHKNLKIAIQAFEQADLADRKLVLFGSARKADFEAQGISVPDNVVFTGFVSEQELKALYSAAAFMVFPSTTEGFGLPPLEAMLVGTPAICAPCGALPEVCGDVATYAAADDADAWQSEIRRHFAFRKDERSELAAACKRQAGAFSWGSASRSLLVEILEQSGIDIPGQLKA